MTINEIISIFKKEKPDLTVVQIIRESAVSYIVCAVSNPNEIDYNGMYFRLIKYGNIIQPYVVTNDIDKFVNLAENHTIYSYNK